jgi:hypothetical protein
VATLSVSASGSATPAQAWERYADPRRWSQWAPQIRRVDTAGERIVAGLRGRVVGPLGVAVSFVVDDVDEDARSWNWSVRFGLIRLRLRHDIEPSGSGARTRLWVSGPLPVVAAYLPVAGWALRRLVAA